MTRSIDIEQLLDAWLDEGPTDTADTVFDATVARIYRQRQRPAWRLQPWRFPTMSTPFKLVAVGAALLVVILGGAVFIGSGGPVVPTPTPTPTPSPTLVPSASPSTAPSESVACPQWLTTGCGGGAGILPAGSQETRSFRPAFTFSVPEGWVNAADTADFYGLFPDSPANEAEFARSGAFAEEIYMGPLSNPWLICEVTGQALGETAAEMAASLATNQALVTSEPVDITIGGLTGKQLDARLDPDWTGSCPPNPEDPTLDFGELRDRAILLDGPDRDVIVIFLTSLYSAGNDAFLAEAMPIIESFQFDLSN